jgi:branched-chain amino acid transport system ATP-binding protein
MSIVLRTQDLRREFGDVVAVDGVSLTFDDGEITSIIGPNGAGKTTFYNLLTGVLSPTAGTIEITSDGEYTDITEEPAHVIAQKGLTRSYQITNIFERLTVRENLAIARISHLGRTMDISSAAMTDADITARFDELLEMTELTPFADQRCDELSHGQKRNVEIALALAIEPSILLMDEPTAGMNPTEVRAVVDLIRELDANLETCFVVTEHNMDVVTDISDRIVVLDQGAVLADGTPSEVLEDDAVTSAYLGEMGADGHIGGIS